MSQCARSFVILYIFTLFIGRLVFAETLSKKTLDGMVLKMLWEKVYAGRDAKAKELAIKKLRANGDYDKLIGQLMKANKEKVQKIINLVGEIMIAYMS